MNLWEPRFDKKNPVYNVAKAVSFTVSSRTETIINQFRSEEFDVDSDDIYPSAYARL